jgi:hypothetical protein
MNFSHCIDNLFTRFWSFIVDLFLTRMVAFCNKDSNELVYFSAEGNLCASTTLVNLSLTSFG